MSQAATAFVEFEGDFTKVGRGADGQAKQLEGTFNSSFKRIAAFASAAIAGIGVGKFLKDAFSAAEDSQKVNRLTAAVIKSTGGAAHVSAAQVDELAGSMAGVDGIDDDVIRSAENVLLTFRDVRNEAGKGNDIFNQGITAATNLSAALGTDLQGSVIQVGKALNDPIKGMTALRRVGVSFTAQQVDQVKALVASGHQLGAQKIILGELTKEFGGAAAAAATPAAKLKASFRQIEESVGGLLIPIFSKLASFIVTTVDPAIVRLIPFLKGLGKVAFAALQLGFGGKSVDQLHGWIKVVAQIGAVARQVAGFVSNAWDDLVGGFQNPDAQIGKSVDGVTTFFLRLGAVIARVVEFVKSNWKPIVAAAAAALALFFAPVITTIAALVALYVRFQLVRDIVADVVNVVQIASHFLAGLPWGQIFSDVAASISTAIGVIETVVGRVVGFFQAHSKDFAAFGKQFAGVWRQLAPTVKAAFDAVVAIVKVAVALIVIPVVLAVKFLIDLWDRFGHQLLDHLRIAFNAVVLVVRGALQVIQGIFEIVTGILTGHWSKAWDGLKDIVAGVGKIIVGAVQFFVNEISTVIGLGMAVISAVWDGAWDHVKGWIIGIFNSVLDFVKRWWPLLLAPITGGLSLVAALFISHFGQIRSFVSGVISDVVGFFTGLPGRILSTLGRIGSAALSIGKAIIGGVVSGVTGAVGKVADIGKAIANATIGFLNSKVLGAIRGGILTLAHALASVNIPGVGRAFDAASSLLQAASRNIPNIPTLDTGAVVTDPTLALLAASAKGQPEIVTPERLMRQVFSDVLAAKKSQLPPIDARFVNNGTIFGVEDLDGWADRRDRKLEHTLAAGARA